MFVVVTVLCLVVLVAQLLGAFVIPVISLFATAWLVLVGIALAIYISGYAIYILSKEHDKHRVPVGATSKKAALPEPQTGIKGGSVRP